MILPFPREAINKIKPYTPGKPVEEVARGYNLDITEIIKLASNENPIGVSPLALEAIKKDISHVNLYPDNNNYYLIKKLAKKFNLSQDNFIIGNGSVEIILEAALAYLEPTSNAIMSNISFIMYPIATMLSGAQIKSVDVSNYKHNLESFLKNIDKNTKIIFIDNPNNPLGSFIQENTLEDFIKAVPSDILVLLDEAYYEYIYGTNTPLSRDWIKKYRNLLVLRTFSKIYGLAGLRIGYGYAHDNIIKNLSKVRLPFNVNRLAQKAALAALDDDDFLLRSKKANEEEKQYLYTELNKIGLKYIRSYTNFILILFDKPILETIKRMERFGVIVRGFKSFPNAMRVSIGTHKENEKFIKVLKDVL